MGSVLLYLGGLIFFVAIARLFGVLGAYYNYRAARVEYQKYPGIIEEKWKPVDEKLKEFGQAFLMSIVMLAIAKISIDRQARNLCIEERTQPTEMESCIDEMIDYMILNYDDRY